MKKLTPIRIEWNNYNGFILEFIGIELENYEGALFGLDIGSNFFYIHLLFFYITIKSPKL